MAGRGATDVEDENISEALVEGVDAQSSSAAFDVITESSSKPLPLFVPLIIDELLVSVATGL